MGTDSLKVFLGARHMAGILWEYRQGLRSIGIDAQVIVFCKHRFQYPADIQFELTGNKYMKFLKEVVMFCIYLPILIRFDVFHFIYGMSMLPLHLDVYILKLFRKKIVMHFVGSEIRPEDSPRANDKKRKEIRFWEKHADAVISFPEYSQLLTKKYYMIPVGYDLEYWKPFTSRISRKKDKILIVHAPSRRSTKGTQYVIEAVESLVEEGFNVEFKILEDSSNAEVRKWVNRSDIVVDQLLIGWYGAFSIESMALAKPTLCYIDEDLKEKTDYARDLPLVNTTPHTLYDNLKLLIENPDLRLELGEKGRKYVEEVHDSKKTAKRLLELYRSI